MAKAVVKAGMPTSVPGSKARLARGFTLLELMVVVAIIAITTAVVSFAIPDSSTTRLEREAARLIALLESARAQARSGAMTVFWLAQPNGQGADYQFLGLPPALMPSLKWMESDVKAEVRGARGIVLGPEPVIGEQSVILRLDDKQIVVGTDGLSPFDVISGNPQDDGDVSAASGALRAP